MSFRILAILVLPNSIIYLAYFLYNLVNYEASSSPKLDMAIIKSAMLCDKDVKLICRFKQIQKILFVVYSKLLLLFFVVLKSCP